MTTSVVSALGPAPEPTLTHTTRNGERSKWEIRAAAILCAVAGHARSGIDGRPCRNCHTEARALAETHDAMRAQIEAAS